MTKSNWEGAFTILVILAILYAGAVYDSFFEVRIGYVYDPGTDRLFKMDLRPSISNYNKWSPLNPFKSMHFGEVDHVEYVGNLHPTLVEIEADQELLKEDVDAWSDKQQRETNKRISEITNGTMELWYLDYFPRWDVKVADLLPDRLSFLNNHSEGEQPDVFAADIIITHRTLQEQRADIEVVRKAVIIRSKGANDLLEMGL